MSEIQDVAVDLRRETGRGTKNGKAWARFETPEGTAVFIGSVPAKRSVGTYVARRAKVLTKDDGTRIVFSNAVVKAEALAKSGERKRSSNLLAVNAAVEAAKLAAQVLEKDGACGVTAAADLLSHALDSVRGFMDAYEISAEPVSQFEDESDDDDEYDG